MEPADDIDIGDEVEFRFAAEDQWHPGVVVRMCKTTVLGGHGLVDHDYEWEVAWAAGGGCMRCIVRDPANIRKPMKEKQ